MNDYKVVKSGFTLVEISIVLVIIGLIVGGILVGQDLIKSAKIRSQISQIEEFKTATNTFKLKYRHLPGDMQPSQAAQLGFFTFTGTYAGMGCTSGGLGHAYGNNDGIVNETNEKYPFWIHLYQSGLVKGIYDGTNVNSTANSCGYAGSYIAAPANISDWIKLMPQSKLYDTLVISVSGKFRFAPLMSSPLWSSINKDNIFILEEYNSGDAVSSYEAYTIDNKIDDGLPATGDVRNLGSADYGSGSLNYDSPCTKASGTPMEYNFASATTGPPFNQRITDMNSKRCQGLIFSF